MHYLYANARLDIGTIKLRADNNNLGSGSARSRLRGEARDSVRVRARVDTRRLPRRRRRSCSADNEAKGLAAAGVTTHPNYIYPRFRIRQSLPFDTEGTLGT